MTQKEASGIVKQNEINEWEIGTKYAKHWNSSATLKSQQSKTQNQKAHYSLYPQSPMKKTKMRQKQVSSRPGPASLVVKWLFRKFLLGGYRGSIRAEDYFSDAIK